jgi:hypothetical protein
MLFALVVMAGVLLLTMAVNNRRTPSRWDGGRSGGNAWVYGGGEGGDPGADCGTDAGGGGCDGGGGGSGD